MAGVQEFAPTHVDTQNHCLTAWLNPTGVVYKKVSGAVARTRTADLKITNQLLYQLSYYSKLITSTFLLPF